MDWLVGIAMFPIILAAVAGIVWAARDTAQDDREISDF
jgi:hypothetical protein